MLKSPEFIQVPFGKIKPWEKNPRGIKQKDLEALAKSITEFGQFQVLTCWQEGTDYITGGGNMRWHAMKKVLHYADDRKVWISLNFPATEADKIKLALRDNQRFGFYEQDKLAELVYPHVQDLNLGDFKLDLGEPIDLKGFIDRYAPSDPDADRSSRDEEETYHFDIVFETKELCEEFLLLIKQIKQKFPDVTIGRAVAELLTEVMK
jgi:hypothetical protein